MKGGLSGEYIGAGIYRGCESEFSSNTPTRLPPHPPPPPHQLSLESVLGIKTTKKQTKKTTKTTDEQRRYM